MDLWHFVNRILELEVKPLFVDETDAVTTIRKSASVLAVLYLVYLACVVIYRLTLHPLAKFPGPFLCRISYIQQCYYEAILNGKFLERLPGYHQKYGPVVRVSPSEVHINDSSLYHTVYKSNSPFTKDPNSYDLGVSGAMAFTVPVEEHKQRRKTLDPNFSKNRVGLMEDGLYEELELVFDKIREYEKRDEEVPIMELYFCYTGDIISRYLFGKSLDFVSSPNFIEHAEQMRLFTKGMYFAVHFQFIRKSLLALPHWMMAYLNNTWVQVLWAIREFSPQEALSKSPIEETIFDRLLTDDARRREKGQNARPLSFRELADESAVILNAGTEPTALMLSYTTYFWFKFPHVQRKVLDELASIELENGRLPLVKLENLPYFTGFIKESLRYMPLFPGRLPRMVPSGGLYVPSIKKTIPEGYVVGFSHLAIHFDPEIFEQPYEFVPERWIGAHGKELNRWLLAFSKGRTDCIGKTLAYAEMYIILANLFTRFNVELTPTGHQDMVWVDRVVAHPTRNLRIKARSKNV